MVAKGGTTKVSSSSNVSSRMITVMMMMASKLSQTKREIRDVSSLTRRTRLVVASHNSLEALEEVSNAETEMYDHNLPSKIKDCTESTSN